MTSVSRTTSLADQLKQITTELTRSRDELSRELHRNEELTRESYDLAAERDGLQAARDSAIAERDKVAAERDATQAHINELEQKIAVAVARSAHLERDSAQLTHRITALEKDAEFLARIRASPVWRYRKPLRFLYRLFSGRQNIAHIRRDLFALGAHLVRSLPLPMALKRRVTRGSLALPGAVSIPLLPTVADAMSLHIAPAQPVPGKADVFVWAVIDWHFRTQRPQHLARALARAGHRVFYVSNHFVDNSQPGFSVEPRDENGRLFQVHLNLAGAPAIYFGLPGVVESEALRRSFASLLGWAGTASSISLVQHPYWAKLSSLAPNVRRVYDCMDHHAGFENNAPALIEAEQVLLKDADLVVVTSDWLEREVMAVARQVAVIRNAGEFAAFSDAPEKHFKDGRGRQVIGYFGAIGEWFDIELVAEVAQAHPDCLVVLVGGDTVGAKKALAPHRNVRMIGEIAYTQLPYWLHGFDVCLLPFQVIPLTLATNPVKVYEYLSAGKPVVSVDLPEMAQFGELVSTAGTHVEFVSAVTLALATAGSHEQSERRKAYAARQTWNHRAAALDDALACIVEPLVTVVVLTYNNLAFTEACLISIEHYSDYPNLEIIVVDNCSTDGSPEFLSKWAATPSAAGHRRRVILNERNLGFAGGNNVGLAEACGQYLVMLNNDTYVTPGWVRSLIAHLRRDSSVGLVGPVTNNIGNEARVDIRYADMVDMIRISGEYTRRHPGSAFAIATVAFFCVAMPRAVYERVGGLDEAFGLGFFEDDDYCRRVDAAGWRIVCAEDVYVHHHLSATFNQMGSDRKLELFQQNKAIYERKWGTWKPHGYREAEG